MFPSATAPRSFCASPGLLPASHSAASLSRETWGGGVSRQLQESSPQHCLCLVYRKQTSFFPPPQPQLSFGFEACPQHSPLFSAILSLQAGSASAPHIIAYAIQVLLVIACPLTSVWKKHLPGLLPNMVKDTLELFPRNSLS